MLYAQIKSNKSFWICVFRPLRSHPVRRGASFDLSGLAEASPAPLAGPCLDPTNPEIPRCARTALPKRGGADSWCWVLQSLGSLGLSAIFAQFLWHKFPAEFNLWSAVVTQVKSESKICCTASEQISQVLLEVGSRTVSSADRAKTTLWWSRLLTREDIADKLCNFVPKWSLYSPGGWRGFGKTGAASTSALPGRRFRSKTLERNNELNLTIKHWRTSWTFGFVDGSSTKEPHMAGAASALLLQVGEDHMTGKLGDRNWKLRLEMQMLQRCCRSWARQFMAKQLLAAFSMSQYVTLFINIRCSFYQTLKDLRQLRQQCESTSALLMRKGLFSHVEPTLCLMMAP